MVTPDANNIIARLWLEMAREDTAFHIAQIETDANCSDEVTRLEISPVVEELGAVWTPPVIPSWFDHIWRHAVFDRVSEHTSAVVFD